MNHAKTFAMPIPVEAIEKAAERLGLPYAALRKLVVTAMRDAASQAISEGVEGLIKAKIEAG